LIFWNLAIYTWCFLRNIKLNCNKWSCCLFWEGWS